MEALGSPYEFFMNLQRLHEDNETESILLMSLTNFCVSPFQST